MGSAAWLGGCWDELAPLRDDRSGVSGSHLSSPAVSWGLSGEGAQGSILTRYLISLEAGEGDGGVPGGDWAAQGSLGACLLPAGCQDLPIFCQACCPSRWSGRLMHLLSFLILQRQCPGAQHQWSALLPLLPGPGRPLCPVTDSPASLIFSHKSILFLE